MSEKRHFGRRRRPSQSRSNETVVAILQASEELFRRLGYEKTTTRKIVQRAGVGIGSLYEYFPNKDAILLQLAREKLPPFYTNGEKLLTAAEGLAAEGLGVFLRAFLKTRLAMVKSDLALHRAFYDAAHPSELRELLETLEEQSVSFVEHCLRANAGLVLSDYHTAAQLVNGSARALIRDFIFEGAPKMEEESFVEEVASMLESYLSGRQFAASCADSLFMKTRCDV